MISHITNPKTWMTPHLPLLPPRQDLPRSLIFSAVLRSRRNSSAPGPNGIPNVIWKRCPSLQKRLYSVILMVWKHLSNTTLVAACNHLPYPQIRVSIRPSKLRPLCSVRGTATSFVGRISKPRCHWKDLFLL